MAKREANSSREDKRQVTRLMKRILAELRASMDDKLRPYGVTTAQLRLLSALRSAPGSSGAELARQCEMTPQSAQALIQRAQQAGWIVRRKDGVNGRIVTASLTPAGSQLLSRAHRLLGNIESRLWNGIPPAAIHRLIDVLETCLLNLDAQ